jgi:hypothetical protein
LQYILFGKIFVYKAFALKAQSFHRTGEAQKSPYLIKGATPSRPCIDECTGLK